MSYKFLYPNYLCLSMLTVGGCIAPFYLSRPATIHGEPCGQDEPPRLSLVTTLGREEEGWSEGMSPQTHPVQGPTCPFGELLDPCQKVGPEAQQFPLRASPPEWLRPA